MKKLFAAAVLLMVVCLAMPAIAGNDNDDNLNSEKIAIGFYFPANTSANTAYLYKVRRIFPSFSEYSAPDLATTVIFTDTPLIPGVTPVRVDHITELRTAVNAVRTLAGLSAGSYTDSTLTPGVAVVKAAHLTDLRTALDAACSALLLPAISYTSPSIVAGTTTISAVDINDLRTGVR
jgi:hypothetical protein